MIRRWTPANWGGVLGLTAIHGVLFKTILDAFGPAGTPLIALPVIAAGWFFSLPGGLVAGLLAVRAGVKQLILTHISCRHRAKDVLAEARAIFPNTFVARDLDTFRISHDIG